MNPQPLLAETQRILTNYSQTTASPGLQTINLPLDTVLKGVSIRLSGSVVVTWSVTAFTKETSIISDLLTSIGVEIDGNRIVLQTYPHLIHMDWLLSRQVQGERRCSVAATAAYNNFPLTDAGFTIPTSTQITTVAETLVVPFEMLYASDQGGRSSTWLDCRGHSSAVLKLNFGSITNLDKTTNLAFSSILFGWQPTTIEAKDFPMQPVENDWRRTFKNVPFAAASTDYLIDLPRGNKCAGINLLVRQDAAGAGAAATSYKPTNSGVLGIRVRRDGREILSTTFQDLQAKNRAEYAPSAAMVSSASRLDGFARINFLQNGNLNTALDVSRESGIGSFELLLTVAANDATNNIQPVHVMVETGELVSRPRN